MSAEGNSRRRHRAAQAVAAHAGVVSVPGSRAGQPAQAEDAEQAISELICDLQHLADEYDLDWSVLQERAECYYAQEAERYVVELTTEGYQVLDTRTDSLRADAWARRCDALVACDALNRASGPFDPGELRSDRGARLKVGDAEAPKVWSR
jgi:hypothetical protein